jgi:hypothetical protein
MTHMDNKSICMGVLLGVCLCLAVRISWGPGIAEANAQAAVEGRQVGQYQAFGVIGPYGTGYYMLNTQTGELWAAFATQGQKPATWQRWLLPVRE